MSTDYEREREQLDEPPLLMKSEFSGKWYIVTKLDENGIAQEKYDVTEPITVFVQREVRKGKVEAYRSMNSIDLDDSSPLEIREIIGGWIAELEKEGK